MRAVVQRVKEASVTIDGTVKDAIGQGLMILLGVEDADTTADADWLAQKVVKLRIFDDEAGVMNRSAADIGGEILVVSQFTLLALTAKGNRPSYIRASRPDHAKPMYEAFCSFVEQQLGKPIGTGTFGADMQIALVNDGPVTIFIDTKNKE